MISRFGPVLLLLGVALSPRTLRAAENEEGSLVQRGTAAFLKEDYESARVDLSQAYGLKARSETLLKLGLSELHAGHAADAAKHLREYLQRPDAPPATVESVRTKWLPRAEAKTARLEVSAPLSAEIVVDGSVLGRAPLGPLVIDEGGHDVIARHASIVESRHILVPGGTFFHLYFQQVDEMSDPSSPAAQPAPPTDAAAAVERRPRASGAKWIALVGLGSGAVIATGLGVGFAVASNNSADEAQALNAQLNDPSKSACTRAAPPSQCAPLGRRLHAASDEHALSDGFYIAGGSLAVAAVLTWLLWPSAASAHSAWVLRPVVGAAGSGLIVSGAW